VLDNANPALSLEQRIRERAYEIYLSRNGDGDELSNWLAAEREIKGVSDQQPQGSPPQHRLIKKSKPLRPQVFRSAGYSYLDIVTNLIPTSA
jgi:hypothetical protein